MTTQKFAMFSMVLIGAQLAACDAPPEGEFLESSSSSEAAEFLVINSTTGAMESSETTATTQDPPEFGVDGLSDIAGRVYLDGLRSDVTFDQFIVKYRDGSAERRDAAAIDLGLAQAARAVASKGRMEPLGLRHLRRMSLEADVIRADRKLNRVDAEALMRAIAAEPDVEYVEVDATLYPVLIPNDPRYPEQWHYNNATSGINLQNAWDKSTGTGIVVAVVDTGSTPHSDLNANTVAGYDFITSTFTSRDGNGRDNNPIDEGDWNPVANECYPGSPVSNSSWHGTHVAGTIAALTNNNSGVAGVAFGARIQHVRVLGRCGGYVSDIADGVVWASGGPVAYWSLGKVWVVPPNPTPARIINMSLGGGGNCSTTFQNAINSAVFRGSTVVVAAGNDNISAANFQPASCANVVTVGATNVAGGRAGFSNYGAAVDLSAPGMSVLSTLNTGTQTRASETYAYYSGTSMAAPHVAGVAALVQSRRVALGLGLLTPALLEMHLRMKVRAFPKTPDRPIGTGIVDADAAVPLLPPPPPPPPPSPVCGNGFIEVGEECDPGCLYSGGWVCLGSCQLECSGYYTPPFSECYVDEQPICP